VLRGEWTESGTAAVTGLGGAGFVLDVEDSLPRWLSGVEATSSDLSFRAEGGRRYLVVAAASVKTPSVKKPLRSRLRNPQAGAEWLLVAPEEFLAAAAPLVALRQSQGLKAKAVSLEEVEQEFGDGEHSPSALKAFLEYAYQGWPKPTLRYVVLLGDGSYDPKDYLKTGVKDRISPYILETSYLWTASDPAYAAVNGEDLVPDLAVGRLPAGSLEQAQALVDRIVAFERAGRNVDQRPQRQRRRPPLPQGPALRDRIGTPRPSGRRAPRRPVRIRGQRSHARAAVDLPLLRRSRAQDPVTRARRWG
jgi:hypothetical protein